VKGVYILLIAISKKILINVGALGSMKFKKGIYAYVGSAQNNLEKRILRHLKKDKIKFWHIDYLLENKAVTIFKVLFFMAAKKAECLIGQGILERSSPIKNFGSSDCKCVSHLFKIKN
jgi:Uri superfamily endonuclease